MICVDLSQIAISNIMANARQSEEAEVSVPLVRHMILNSLRAYRQKFKKDFGELVIACDKPSYWRKKEFPFYKANRKTSRSSSFVNWDQIFDAINQVKMELKTVFPYAVIDIEGAEADDVIGTLAAWSWNNDLGDVMSLEEPSPNPFLILSGDKDFVQLQKFPHVRQFAPVSKQWITADGPVEFVLTEHILRGDEDDGVPNFLSVANSLVDKIRQKSVMKDKMAVWRTQPLSVWEGTPEEARVKENQQLIDLSFTPQYLKDAIITQYLADRDVRDRSKLFTFFVQNRMKDLLEHVGAF